MCKAELGPQFLHFLQNVHKQMSIDINCIAVIGKQNNPLYIKNYSSSHPDLKYHYIAHTAIDVIEERVLNNPKLTDAYLGLLYAMEDLAVYGFMTNTRVKIILVIAVTDNVIKDADIKAIFTKVHSAYVSHVCNPFHNLDQDFVASKRFSNAVDHIGQQNSRATIDV
ncbi:Sedlin, N-terminal conserved region-domain-containing protein [Umbelopsis sp. AD052]|nr:Sedlin, N-terminal conserved region-domain-containing protein [Umbelopsis sp. AD052]